MSDTKKFILIEADYNDADYVTKETELEESHLEQLDVLKKVAAAVAERGFENWKTGEHTNATLKDQYPQFSEAEIKLFDYFVPVHEYGIHSIEKIEIREVKVLERLL